MLVDRMLDSVRVADLEQHVDDRPRAVLQHAASLYRRNGDYALHRHYVAENFAYQDIQRESLYRSRSR